MFLACATRLQLFSASSIPNFPLFASIILSAQTDGLCKHTYDGDDDNIWWLLYLEWHIWYDDVDDYGSIFVSIICECALCAVHNLVCCRCSSDGTVRDHYETYDHDDQDNDNDRDTVDNWQHKWPWYWFQSFCLRTLIVSALMIKGMGKILQCCCCAHFEWQCARVNAWHRI